MITSLALVSVLGMIWLLKVRPDTANMADHAGATLWYVLPSLPMFLLIRVLLRRGTGFWSALLADCMLTIGLDAVMTFAAPRFGIRL